MTVALKYSLKSGSWIGRAGLVCGAKDGLCPGSGGEQGAKEMLSSRQTGGRWERCWKWLKDSEFCFTTAVCILTLEVRRSLLGSRGGGSSAGMHLPGPVSG